MRTLLASLFLLPPLLGAAPAAVPDESSTAMIVAADDAIAAPLTEVAADPVEGRRIFVDREAGHCVLCHRIAALDVPFQGNVGPALDGVGARLTTGQIRARIVDASRANPATIMPPYHRTAGLVQVAGPYEGETVLSAEAVEHLVAWLATLEAPGE